MDGLVFILATIITIAAFGLFDLLRDPWAAEAEIDDLESLLAATAPAQSPAPPHTGTPPSAGPGSPSQPERTHHA